MSSTSCPGCQREFPSTRALGSHLRFCKEYQTAPARILDQRQRNYQVLQAAREQMVQAQREALLQGEMEVVEEVVPEPIPELVPVVSPTLCLRSPPILHSLQPDPTPPPAYRPSGLPARVIRRPRRFDDELPPAPVPVAPVVQDDPDDIPHLQDEIPDNRDSASEHEEHVVQTQKNSFGIYREYIDSLPSYTPDEYTNLADICNSPSLIDPSSPHPTAVPWWMLYAKSARNLSTTNYFAPFPNASTFLLMNWFHGASNLKSHAELNRLVKEVILAEDFRPEDLETFNAAREADRLDTHEDDSSPIFSAKDGWLSASVSIHVPSENVSFESEGAAPVFHVKGLYHRKIVEVVKSALQESSASQYHLTPYREYIQPTPDDPAERIYSEIYNTDAMIEEHLKIKAQPRDCKLETFVIPILLWSDSTLLASFGDASLWPIYLFLGNLTKYTRCKPSSFSAHHIAYIPKVSPPPCFSDARANIFAAWRRISRLLSEDIRQARVCSNSAFL